MEKLYGACWKSNEETILFVIISQAFSWSDISSLQKSFLVQVLLCFSPIKSNHIEVTYPSV
jgi:hypothetical protein